MLAGACLLAPSLDRIPFRRAEIYFADAARTMVESGDWLVPHFEGAPFFDKPALTYWLMSASFDLLGFSRSAGRLPQIAATLAVILITSWIGRMLWGSRAGWMAGLVLIATPSFMDFGRMAMSDMLLTLWSTLAVALTLQAYRSGRAFLPLVALGFTMGLGFLTKGPIAWITPGLGMLSIAWHYRDRRPAIPPLAAAIAAVTTVIVGFAWFAAVYQRMGWAPLEHFFFRENLARFSGAAYDVGQPIWFFPETYLHEGAPWSLFLPLAAFFLLWRQPDRDARWLFTWMLLDVVLLSSSHGKLGYYLLPLYPAVSLVMARYFLTAQWGRAARGFVSVTLIAMAAALGLLIWAMWRIPAGWGPEGVVLSMVVVALAAAALACVFCAARPRPRSTLTILIAVSAVAFAMVEQVILPAFHDAQPNRAIAEWARRESERRPELRVAAREDFSAVSRELHFDARMLLERSSDPVSLAASPHPYLLIAEPAEAAELARIPNVRILAEYRYLPSSIFSRKGLVSGVEPRSLALVANFVE